MLTAREINDINKKREMAKRHEQGIFLPLIDGTETHGHFIVRRWNEGATLQQINEEINEQRTTAGWNKIDWRSHLWVTPKDLENAQLEQERLKQEEIRRKAMMKHTLEEGDHFTNPAPVFIFVFVTITLVMFCIAIMGLEYNKNKKYVNAPYGNVSFVGSESAAHRLARIRREGVRTHAKDWFNEGKVMVKDQAIHYSKCLNGDDAHCLTYQNLYIYNPKEN